MILFFDTETTGFPDKALPVTHERQPHLVQVAALLTESDGTERAHFSLIIKPPVKIPDAASAVHGISDELAERAGVVPLVGAQMWNRLARKATLWVAHNIGFDIFVMESALTRILPEEWRHNGYANVARFCTMAAATPILNLPPTERMVARGYNKPKAPKLSECISHFFGETLDGAHNAMVDVRACARVYFHLQRTMREKAA